ncbi:hypothetical protein F4808DRAFT_184702 [Astrocystis sublimbata]|nr:hypothetical protein F4808DRAFT_184702 [Astrocystis sublimbata]
MPETVRCQIRRATATRSPVRLFANTLLTPLETRGLTNVSRRVRTCCRISASTASPDGVPGAARVLRAAARVPRPEPAASAAAPAGQPRRAGDEHGELDGRGRVRAGVQLRVPRRAHQDPRVQDDGAAVAGSQHELLVRQVPRAHQHHHRGAHAALRRLQPEPHAEPAGRGRRGRQRHVAPRHDLLGRPDRRLPEDPQGHWLGQLPLWPG